MLLKKQFPWIFWYAICLLLALGPAAEAPAQKRIFARVEPNAGTIESTGELYDPDSGRFTPTADAMSSPRRSPTATLLPDGLVLMTGGYNFTYLDTAEIYDPSSGAMVPAEGLMLRAREGHRATLLNSGLVLITGGFSGVFHSFAELYIPSLGTFDLATGSLVTGRAWHSATLLSDGRVFIAGGFAGTYLSSAETYDPSTGLFTAAAGILSLGRSRHTATLLPSGKVLIAGGYNGVNSIDGAEIYDPETGIFTATGAMTGPRESHTATPLPDGTILITGGRDNEGPVGTAEIFNPSTGTFTSTSGTMARSRLGHTATSLPNQSVLILGGTDGSEIVDVAEIYDPATGVFTPTAGAMVRARRYHAAVLLPNGRVLTVGGENSELLTFDINRERSDNVSPNISFSSDSKRGFVGFTGSGRILVFDTDTGEIVKMITTGGQPAFATPLLDGRTLAVVSAFDDKIFLIDMDSNELLSTHIFPEAFFGFGSILTLTRDGNTGYISSTGSGEIIKINPTDGSEMGRAGGLQAPAQITLTNDEATLLVVDAFVDDLIFFDAATLSRDTSLDVKSTYPEINFTLFNKAVLSPDGSRGILASRDFNGDLLVPDSLFHFDVEKAEVLDKVLTGSEPGYTAITPDGGHWIILNEHSLSIISTEDFADRRQVSTIFGGALGSANLVITADSKHAFYVSSPTDLFFQHDLETTAIVDLVLVGDDPNYVLDQPSSVGLTPDGKTLAVLNFMGNTIELLTDVTVMEGTKLLSAGDRFTGLSLVNLSDSPARVSLFARDDIGSLIRGEDVVNPAIYTLQPNAQISMTMDEIFQFDYQSDQVGRFTLFSDQPEIVGYVSYGRVKATWLGSFIDRLDGVPLLRERFHDWIVPEIKRQERHSLELNFVNPGYNDSAVELLRFERDGVLAETRAANTFARQRQSAIYDEIFLLGQGGRVLMVGGRDSESVNQTAEIYDVLGNSFSETAGAMTTGRADHTATLLPNGSVLIAGGSNEAPLKTAEIYNPSTTAFQETDQPMEAARTHHTATLLRRSPATL